MTLLKLKHDFAVQHVPAKAAANLCQFVRRTALNPIKSKGFLTHTLFGNSYAPFLSLYEVLRTGTAGHNCRFPELSNFPAAEQLLQLQRTALQPLKVVCTLGFNSRLDVRQPP